MELIKSNITWQKSSLLCIVAWTKLFISFNMIYTSCYKNNAAMPFLCSWFLFVTSCCTIFFSNVTHCKLYSPHNIPPTSQPKNHIPHVTTFVPMNPNMAPSSDSDEYQPLDFEENSLRSNEISSFSLSAQKVKNQLLKDMGLNKLPDTRQVSYIWSKQKL